MSDNRDTLMKIGKLIAPDDAESARDAVHIAVIPMVAREYLAPAFLVDATGAHALSHAAVGIVDPFLREGITKGIRFWCFLFPGSITSLRHAWTHPAFPESMPVILGHGPKQEPVNQHGTNDEARHWLRWYAESLDLTYRQLMEGAEEWLRDDEYLNAGSNLEGVSTSEKFWHNYDLVMGKTTPDDKRENFFSCSC